MLVDLHTTQIVLNNDCLNRKFRQVVFNAAHKYTIGAGLAYEGVKTNRYDDDKFRTQLTNYLYIQHEFSWRNKVEWVNGIRYDMNPVYGNQWSPKTAIQWTVFPELKLKTSFGTGFKSPDFRYLYLNFRNAAAGYFVYGTSELKSELELLDQKVKFNNTSMMSI